MSSISAFKGRALGADVDHHISSGEWASLAHEYARLPRPERQTVHRWLGSQSPRLQRILGSGALSPTQRVGALRPLPSSNHLQALARRVVRTSMTRVPERPGETRHELNQRLYQQNWTAPASGTEASPAYRYDGSDVVIIAFEGTGAFEPRFAPAISELSRILRASGHDVSNLHAYQLIANAVEQLERREVRWSGLARGPQQMIAQSPALASSVQWLSFPSEELELLSAKDAFKDTSIPDIIRETSRSIDSEPAGIMNALAAMKSIAAQAHAQGKNPKFVVVSHSSGGRSAVKFLEHAKKHHNPVSGGRGYRFPLVFTIDPVREAHEAVLEAARELLNKATERGWNKLKSWVGLEQRRVYPPTVRSRWQRSSLYQVSNSDRHVNFYQQQDEEGLKMKPRFSIHGSPIHGTTDNMELPGSENLGTAGHGEIAYHPRVLARLRSELSTLLR